MLVIRYYITVRRNIFFSFGIFFLNLNKDCLYLHSLLGNPFQKGEVGEWLKPAVC